jgi:hypothetical protein
MVAPIGAEGQQGGQCEEGTARRVARRIDSVLRRTYLCLYMVLVVMVYDRDVHFQNKSGDAETSSLVFQSVR